MRRRRVPRCAIRMCQCECLRWTCILVSSVLGPGMNDPNMLSQMPVLRQPQCLKPKKTPHLDVSAAAEGEIGRARPF
jgi:hypothetical protein